MAAFKDKKNGSWYVQFRYTDCVALPPSGRLRRGNGSS